MTAILQADALCKIYGSTTALAGVDLTIQAGESLAVMGASGSGKTTLLHTLAGVISPDSGRVRFHLEGGPVDVTTMNDAAQSRLRRESFGFVFQQGLLLPELTAAENVALALLLNGVARAEAEQRARVWLGTLGLAGMEDQRIGQLSGGQAQRVAIARAQVTGAPVVFADEPTGALDSQTSAEVMAALLHATTGQGRTLVVVTHDRTVAALCSRTVQMHDGRIVAEWTRDSAAHPAPHPAGGPAANPALHPTMHAAAATTANQAAHSAPHPAAGSAARPAMHAAGATTAARATQATEAAQATPAAAPIVAPAAPLAKRVAR